MSQAEGQVVSSADAPARHRTALERTVGLAAVLAPALHSVTDLMEWLHGGFSAIQLWLNYLAFLPMAWMLLGLYVVLRPRGHALALAGALLYGVAFTYFAHTTLFALATRAATYEALWDALGTLYTVHGALMVGGGLLFAGAGLHSGWTPRWALGLFAAGLAVNLLLALLPAPDILQTVGSGLRNLGLMGLGWAVLAGGASEGLR